jgi:hypothetical protein
MFGVSGVQRLSEKFSVAENHRIRRDDDFTGMPL